MSENEFSVCPECGMPYIKEDYDWKICFPCHLKKANCTLKKTPKTPEELFESIEFNTKILKCAKDGIFFSDEDERLRSLWIDVLEQHSEKLRTNLNELEKVVINKK